MYDYKKLDLIDSNNKPFFYFTDQVTPLKLELETLVNSLNYMHSKTFTKKVLFPYEVKFNNAIETYNDDIELISNTIHNKKNITTEKERRIINLYRGYQYILKNNITINQENLKHLYTILSNGLISDEDKKNMGNYYRNGKNMITSPYLDKPDFECFDFQKLHQYMDSLFTFINKDNNFNLLTDYYIKSQIIHFYFVYLHPYFDINGRTSRTTSMWYLLNNEAYPYIIFNRCVMLHRNKYCIAIEEAIKYRNLTFFINYMQQRVLEELEKEYFIDSINASNNNSLSNIDIQTLQYIISFNGQKNVNHFANMYNNFNEKKSKKEILEIMIKPLIEKDIIKTIRETNKNIYGNTPNFIFDFNYKKIEFDKEKVKHLSLNI